ncbi:MAG: hypothetical protein ACR2OX_06380 [Methyloligellaceae bacterium]
MAMVIKVAALVVILLIAFAPSALADIIDGTWCSPLGKTISIDGPSVVTPGGNTVVARYDRHHIDYVIPAGEPNAGDRLAADQLNEEQIRVSVVSDAKSSTVAPEIWTPCKPIS